MIQETFLNIDDVKLEIIRQYDDATKCFNKELIMTYKTIFINTYNVHVFDLSAPENKRTTLYIHESFHLWEN
jgi:hypothetical protein